MAIPSNMEFLYPGVNTTPFDTLVFLKEQKVIPKLQDCGFTKLPTLLYHLAKKQLPLIQVAKMRGLVIPTIERIGMKTEIFRTHEEKQVWPEMYGYLDRDAAGDPELAAMFVRFIGKQVLVGEVLKPDGENVRALVHEAFEFSPHMAFAPMTGELLPGERNVALAYRYDLASSGRTLFSMESPAYQFKEQPFPTSFDNFSPVVSYPAEFLQADFPPVRN